jgi:hypothetical protein
LLLVRLIIEIDIVQEALKSSLVNYLFVLPIKYSLEFKSL